MRKKVYLAIAISLSLVTVLLAFIARVQGRQQLQYRSSRDARKIVGGLGYQRLGLTAEKPEVMNLPDFKERYPLFFKWSSPMAQSGHLFIAIDCTDHNGSHDLLYIDTNGDGNLKDETVIHAYRTNSRYTYFGPVKITLENEESPITYHLNFQLYDYGPRTLLVHSGCWYEGTITVEGVKKQCMLIDYNANGTFNDKSLESNKSDRIQIGTKGKKKAFFVGNYIEIDDKIYRLEATRDGASIKLAAADDVAFGKIQVPEMITEFAAAGENGLFMRKPDNGIVELPLGKYRINRWSIERKDNAGNNWKLDGSGFSEKGIFEVKKTEEIKVTIGEPIISSLDVQIRSETLYFRLNMEGQLDESITITRNGARPPAPKLCIKSEDGKYERTYDFRYG